MGMCVSTLKKDKKAKKLHDIMVSPEKDKLTVAGEVPVTAVDLASHPWSLPSVATIRDHDSKEETFFDSQPWLNSDSEDDFMSVNGDFTPSRGSTPRHPNFSPKIPSFSKLTISDKLISIKSEDPPIIKKRSLVELFRDSIRVIDHSDTGEHNVCSEEKGTTGEQNIQYEDDGTITNGENEIKERPSKYCFPRMLGGRRSIDANTKTCPPSAFTTY